MKSPKQQLLDEIGNAAKHGYPFYVYTLADGKGVFYVGKGKGARVFQHQKLQGFDANTAKIARIRACGVALVHSVVAYFTNAGEAFSAESLMIRTLDGLTNLALGDPVTPYEKAKRRAQDILDRIVPFDQWQPNMAALGKLLEHLGIDTPRQYYDRLIAEVKTQIEAPCPTSMEFDSSGKLVRCGYNETHTSASQRRCILKAA